MTTMDNTIDHPANPPAAKAPWRSRALRQPLVRGVLAVLIVMALFSGALLLAELVPKPQRQVWPFLLGTLACFSGYWIYVRKIERRALDEFALAPARRELPLGIVAGITLGLITLGVIAAFGQFAMLGTGDPLALVKPLPEQLMVAFLEEILMRAILFRLVEKSWGTRIAMVVSMVIFVAMHLPNEHINLLGALATAAAASALAAAFVLTRRLWLSIGMHFGWNSLFDTVFAIPVSGHPARGFISVKLSGPEWFSGGAYGVEASVVTLVWWSLATVGLLMLARRRGQLLTRPRKAQSTSV